MARVHVVVVCDDPTELAEVVAYCGWKGHRVSDATLTVDKRALTVTAFDFKVIDQFYMVTKVLGSVPPPPPYVPDVDEGEARAARMTVAQAIAAAAAVQRPELPGDRLERRQREG